VIQGDLASKDDNQTLEFQLPECCASESFKKFLDPIMARLNDISKRLTAAMTPRLMLFVQFSYIYFIFDEAYRNYDGGVCPGYRRGEPRLGSSRSVGNRASDPSRQRPPRQK
jgi:hypothetical protein